VAWLLGIAGLAAYNWWILVPLVPGLMKSPSELFSNMEVTGQPYAAAMQHADLASGLLLAGAFLAIGSRGILTARREWVAMMVFAIAGALGGIFPEVCADEVSVACRSVEWKFQLPVSQYLHMAVGIVEFAAITFALLLAVRRTRDERTRSARIYRELAIGALVGYPLLGAAYLTDRLGGLVEPVFFVGFTVMVLTQLAERTKFAWRADLPGRGAAGTSQAGGAGQRAGEDASEDTTEPEIVAAWRRHSPAAMVRSVSQGGRRWRSRPACPARPAGRGTCEFVKANLAGGLPRRSARGRSGRGSGR